MFDSQTIEMELETALADVNKVVTACENWMANNQNTLDPDMRHQLHSEIGTSHRILDGYCDDPMLLSRTAVRHWQDAFHKVWGRARSITDKLSQAEAQPQPVLA